MANGKSRMVGGEKGKVALKELNQPTVSLLTDDDVYLFNEGKHYRLYDKLGAHGIANAGGGGTYFAVWAPNAERVSIIGNFNGWDKASHALNPRGQSGIWEGFFPNTPRGTLYKYHIATRF